MNEPQKDGPPTADERQGYIGGSDLAGILSLSPYSTPFQVFAQKVGAEIATSPDPGREEKFFWGHALEAPIAKGFMQRFKIPVRRSKEPFYRHPVHNFMGGHLDFEVDHTGQCIIVECKNIEFQSDEWGEPLPLSEDSAHLVPLYYLAQCDHYMAIRDASHTYLIALFGGCHLKAYRINRSEERERLAIAAESLFWQRVLNDDPPPFSGNDDLVAAMQAGYIEHYGAKRAKAEKIKIQLDEVAATLVETVAKEARKEKAAHKARQLARSALLKHLEGKTGYLYIGNEKHGSFLTMERENFDEFSFKMQHPEIHAKFAKTFLVGPILRLPKDKMEEESNEPQE